MGGAKSDGSLQTCRIQVVQEHSDEEDRRNDKQSNEEKKTFH